MQRQPSQIRQAQIKKAVLDIISEEGLHSISSRNVAKRVGITDGAIFRHFKSKREIRSSERIYVDAGMAMTGVKRGDLVLDIGFGTGNALTEFAEAVGESGHAFGVDLSDGMCRTASRKLEKASVAERVSIACGDAALLPFVNESFDLVFMSFSLELFGTPEIPAVLGECKRVSKRGGAFCIVGLSRRGRRNAMTRIYDWAHAKFPRQIDCRPVPIRALVEDAGFEVKGVSECSMWSLPVDVIVAGKD